MSLSEGIVDFPNDPGTLGYLTAGNPTTGTNSDGADNDAYQVFFEAGKTYSLHVGGISFPSGYANSDVFMALYGPDGTLIGTTAAPVQFSPYQTGMYVLSVQGGGGWGGSYEIGYDAVGVADDRGATLEAAQPLVGQGLLFGQIDFAGDADAFRIDMTAGHRYFFEYSTTVQNLFFNVEDVNYENLSLNLVNGTGAGTYTAQESGSTLLVLESGSMATGAYGVYCAETYSATANLIMGGFTNDVLVGTSGSDEMHGGWGIDRLAGGDGTDFLFGGASNEGDTLDGGAGTDLMAGGLGNDTYVVDNAGDVVVEGAGEGTDTVQSSISLTLGANLENLTLAGAAAINGTGNDSANVINGNTGANVLTGGGGNDTLNGGAGNDTLIGSSGSDTLAGGDGNDTYYVDSAYDIVNEVGTVASTADQVVSAVNWSLDKAGNLQVEQLTLAGSASNGTGNALANTIVGNALNNVLSGGAGDDTLHGAAGNDTLNGGTGNDTLDGGTGVDTLAGGDGNDVYLVDSVYDIVNEAGLASSTLDRVVSSVNWSLNKTGNLQVEQLTLSGAALNGTGNALANILVGNAGGNLLDGGVGNDTIDGGVGNDTLVGGAGNDRLTGGAGKDWFRLDAAASATGNVDRIVDFSVPDDTIQIQNAIFTTVGAEGGLAAAAFHAGTKAGDTSDRVIYNASTGQIFYDADGSGAAAQTLIATITAGTALTAADFAVI
jgi:Ca2+-binding RTX toxin-like protein